MSRMPRIKKNHDPDAIQFNVSLKWWIVKRLKLYCLAKDKLITAEVAAALNRYLNDVGAPVVSASGDTNDVIKKLVTSDVQK